MKLEVQRERKSRRASDDRSGLSVSKCEFPCSSVQPRRSPSSRQPMRRMILIHMRLHDAAYPNCRKLAEEWEVSAKTIQRDIEFMRDQLRLPIGYDRERHGFYYTETVMNFAFPAIVSEGEVPNSSSTQDCAGHTVF